MNNISNYRGVTSFGKNKERKHRGNERSKARISFRYYRKYIPQYLGPFH